METVNEQEIRDQYSLIAFRIVLGTLARTDLYSLKADVVAETTFEFTDAVMKERAKHISKTNHTTP